jgi:iron complex transport system permease protein
MYRVGPAPIFSLIGSFFALGATFLLGSIGGNDILRLVVSGVVVNSVLSSAISLISLYLYTSAASVLSWTLGHIRIITSQEWIVLIISLLLCFSLILQSRKLDVLTLSKEEAMSLGLNYQRETLLLLTLAALGGSLVSSLFGVFSFVGVVAPNMARRVISGGHLKLFVYSSLIGAELTAISDVVARSALSGIEVPTGLVVSFAGALFYLYFFWRMSHDRAA